MRIFVAGASGVIGLRLVPQLAQAGHHVVALTRTPEKARRLAELGATPVVGDVYDPTALTRAVVAAAPDLVVNQLTDLPDDPADLPAARHANARIRREGTDHLLRAARAAGATRILAQSIAWPLTGVGAAAGAHLEGATLGAGGVVLRYGQFYGPGTYHVATRPDHPRIHVDAAARRTVDLLDAPSGVVTVVEPPESASSS